ASLSRLAALLHGSTHRSQCLQRHLTLCNADGNRASQLQHTVQDADGDGHFSEMTIVLATAQPIADHLLVAPDGGLDPAACVVADTFCQPIRPFSAILRRWRSRCVGLVSAVSLSTAVARGGTITAASGSWLVTGR